MVVFYFGDSRLSSYKVKEVILNKCSSAFPYYIQPATLVNKLLAADNQILSIPATTCHSFLFYIYSEISSNGIYHVRSMFN